MPGLKMCYNMLCFHRLLYVYFTWKKDFLFHHVFFQVIMQNKVMQICIIGSIRFSRSVDCYVHLKYKDRIPGYYQNLYDREANKFIQTLTTKLERGGEGWLQLWSHLKNITHRQGCIIHHPTPSGAIP